MRERTIEALRSALAATPENVPLAVHLASLLVDRGALDEAADLLRRAIALDPDDREAHVLLGLAEAGRQNFAAAECAYRAAVRLAPKDPFPHRQLADVLLRRDQIEEAARWYNRAVVLNPEFRDPHFEGAVYGILGPTARLADPAEAADPAPGGGGTFGAGPGEARAAREEEGAGAFTPPDADAWRGEEGDGEGEADEDDAENRPVEATPRRFGLTFNDVGGLAALKEAVRAEFLFPIARPELFRPYKKGLGGGALLYGPPGCGKTLFARALSGEAPCGFYAVDISQVFDVWHGEGDFRLHEGFRAARRNAPSILFIDEIDALAARRSGERSPVSALTNQLLCEIEEAVREASGVLVIGATSTPWDIDPAFLRPGRLARRLFVSPPGPLDREAILRLSMRGRPMEAVDFAAVATATPAFSGADLHALCEEAAGIALRRSLTQGAGVTPIRGDDLLAAAGRVTPAVRDWFECAAAPRHGLDPAVAQAVAEFLNSSAGAEYRPVGRPPVPPPLPREG